MNKLNIPKSSPEEMIDYLEKVMNKITSNEQPAVCYRPEDEELLDILFGPVKEHCVCDCTKNYSKTCKYPDKHQNGGCNE